MTNAATPTKTTKPMPTSAKPATRTAPRKKVAVKPGSKAKGSPAVTKAPSTAPSTKRQQLADLLTRGQGATLDQMVAATGWLPHTVRAAMTGLRKAGYRIDSDRVDGLRTWRAVAP